ncbi:M16 family metallopeptidase [Alkalilacustris brevis]|uniref:M16 family metallopeptidase n=1 Tax=Alkalilacustris brevis TaxID=2026338 RepID=UPI000E0D450E|nr:pitrilysin family protein [Alkalilacustris brevis]
MTFSTDALRRTWPLALIAALVMLALPLRAEPVTGFALDNGLEVVVIEDHRAPAVTHMLWYRVGAADEPPGKSGIAHFLEHLMFKGTDSRDAGEFSAIVEALGGRDNAFTSWDYTGYFQRVAVEHLGRMMELEADRMANLAFTEDDWRPERAVVLEERGQVVEARPGRLFQEQLAAAMFQNHPYGIPIIGWRHEIEGLTDEDAMEFYARHYSPDNAVLVVAGAIDPDEVRALAEAHYGPIPANPERPDRVRPQEPPHLAERRLSMTDPRVAQPYLLRQYLTEPRRSGAQEDAAALLVLAEVLGGNRATSVLGRKLTFEKPALAISASAFYSPVAVDGTTFGLAVVPAEGVSLQEAEDALDTALAEFLEDGIAPEQFERVQTQIRAAEIYGRDNVQSRARSYGAALSSGLTVADEQGWTEALTSVTPDDVMTAAQRVLDRNRSVTGWLMGPDGDTGVAAPSSAPGVEAPMSEVSQ